MGASGCGKTTLMSSLVGVLSLDSGNVEVFGEPPGKNRLRVGFMPQETALVEVFTVREVLWFYGTMYGLSSVAIEDKVDFLCELLELPDKDKVIGDCSGGQKRRISFAVSLVHDPELLVLDEPTVGLDPLLRSKLWDYLLELTHTNHVTVLLSTHYTEEAKQSSCVGLMRNGVLLAEDEPRKILQRTETSHLDEAFFMLSQGQLSASSLPMSAGERSSKPAKYTKKPVTGKTRNPKPMKALLRKSFLEAFRKIE